MSRVQLPPFAPNNLGGRLRHLYQRYRSDCFPTCIAMVADISHREAMQLVHPFHMKGQDYGTYDKRGVHVLRQLGFKVRKRYLKNFTQLKDIAIISLTHEKGPHVAVWDPFQKRILEPSRVGCDLPYSWYKKRINHVFILT
jgi:ABC-type bacteriocin/lantibiotic exporter with double-glycine peptidase domain